MIVGVGGQGTLLASRVLGSVGMREGCDVKVSEIHGMSQRGGSVVTYVKMGGKVHSPVIEEGEAHIVLAFEKLEALRWIRYLRPDGRIILNSQRIDPLPVILGESRYPDGVIREIKKRCPNVQVADALETARKCGNPKTMNVVLIGLLARSTRIKKETWLKALRDVIPERLLEVNLKAFEEGYNYSLV